MTIINTILIGANPVSMVTDTVCDYPHLPGKQKAGKQLEVYFGSRKVKLILFERDVGLNNRHFWLYQRKENHPVHKWKSLPQGKHRRMQTARAKGAYPGKLFGKSWNFSNRHPVLSIKAGLVVLQKITVFNENLQLIDSIWPHYFFVLEDINRR